MANGIDAAIDAAVRPISDAIREVVFYSVSVMGTDVPLIVAWLVAGAAFFTVYFGFINLRGFGHAIDIVSGKYRDPNHPGEVSHFRALTAAVSGTVGVGNIAGVAITISLGGPGAAFWLMIAGLLGMTTKFVECTLGVKYRRQNPDGSVSGGPMYYLERGLAERGLPRLGKVLGIFFAASIVIGCLGIGNMFQSNQAFVQFLQVAGGETGSFADKGWLFGSVMAVVVALILIGGIKSIGSVTAKLVPFMIVFYIAGCVAVIFLRLDAVPGALAMVWQGAFTSQGMAGGAIGALILGFQRAAFSNEAGLGSAAIAHSAVQTDQPLTEGYVALLEPFIDTVVVCSLTALVLMTTIYSPDLANSGLAGIEMTSAAFASVLPWAPEPLAVAAILFAFSTMIAWAYYGLKGWTYLLGESHTAETVFKAIYCGFIVLGASVQLSAILDFADALIFVMAFPNLIGLYILAPTVKADLKAYQSNMTGR